MNKLLNLIETRKIISFVVVGLFVYLAVKGVLEVNFMQNVIISVIAFYFGQSTARDNPKKETPP